MFGVHLLLLLAIGALVVILVPGYGLWLRTRRRRTAFAPAAAAEREREGEGESTWPTIDIVVPVWNEAPGIDAKLANLAALDLPDRGVRILVVDGASQDGTRERVAACAERDARIELLRLDRADKTAQLNLALESARATWVVVSDADAELPADALRELFAAAARDPGLAVLGTVVEPAAAHPLEARYWRAANDLRLRESETGYASIVTGPCYAFRRSLLARFPDDVVADDVHVAMEAAVQGRGVAFVDCTVVELRSPLGLAELFHHKRRKATAYVREVLRFLPRAPRMRGVARSVFLWRSAQLLGFPALVAAGGLVALHGAATAAPNGTTTLAALAVLPVLAVSGRIAGGARDGPFVAFQLGLLLAAVQLTSLLIHPIARPSNNIARLREAGG